MELLFDRLDTMNAACVDRFSSWFAYHLSNFQFRWRWDDWNSTLTLDPLHPKPKFIRETLSRCMRLSYHHLIMQTLPQSFHEFMPEVPLPHNKYAQEGAESLPGHAVAQSLMEAIKQKCTPEEAAAIIKELPNPLHEVEDGIL